MSLVLDASVVMAWALDEEASAKVQEIVTRVVAAGAVVPSIWRLEIANALRTAMRRKRLSLDQRDATLEDLGSWDIAIDGETHMRAWSGILRLSDRFSLTPYDACYLELADRRGLALATLDADLARAASAMRVPLSL